MKLKTRKPTGAVPWPVVLIEGGEKSGKSWAAAEFSASERVGTTYWIDIREGAADEYGAIPGARYEVVEHDGTFGQIFAAVEAVRAEARRAAQAGELPTVLVIDSMSAEWDLLKEWAEDRARGSKRNQDRLKQDPAAEIDVSMNYWNDATARHRKLMTLLLTFPGIVVLTAKGKEVVAVDSAGKPLPNAPKDYKVEGQKNLAFDASVWVRMSRKSPPTVIGARSVHVGVRPGVDKPTQAKNFTIEWLVFDVLKCDPSRAHVRALPTGEPTEADEARGRLREWATGAGMDLRHVATAYESDTERSLRDETDADAIDEFLQGLQTEAEQDAAPAESEERAA